MLGAAATATSGAWHPARGGLSRWPATDERAGAQMIGRAPPAPARQIAEDPVVVGGGVVERIALENAVSVSSVLLLAKAAMTELPEPRPV